MLINVLIIIQYFASFNTHVEACGRVYVLKIYTRPTFNKPAVRNNIRELYPFLENISFVMIFVGV